MFVKIQRYLRCRSKITDLNHMTKLQKLDAECNFGIDDNSIINLNLINFLEHG